MVSDSLEEDFAFRVQKLNRKARSAGLNDDFVVKCIREIVKSTERSNSRYICQAINEVIQDTTDSVSLSSAECMVWASNFRVFGLHS